MKRGIFWFRTDLRLSDNLALQAALEACEEIVPVYILDERWMGKDRWGFDRTGPFRLRFLTESLRDLKAHLQEVGSDLIVTKGQPEVLLPEIADQYDCDGIFGSKAYTHEELVTERRLAGEMEVRLFHNHPLIHPDDIPFSIGNMPEVFTDFRKRVESRSPIREPIPSPDEIRSPRLTTREIPGMEELGSALLEADPRAAMVFRGGALEAWNRLEHYFWDSQSLSKYKETRNGMVGADYSSKFSPWLAHGCISARAIYHEVKKYEREVAKNSSTYWMIFELLWRDFFIYTAMRYGNAIFLPGGIRQSGRSWPYQPKVFQKWIDGETGDEFVDANMKELKLTGFMSNRGRQNVASYLVHHLKQDWRAGAAWFESMLVDYDVTSNYGNWMYVAGVGNDPRSRQFNTRKQAERYDGDGAYRKLWLQEEKAAY